MAAIASLISFLAVYFCVWGTYKRYKIIQNQREQIRRQPSEPLFQQKLVIGKVFVGCVINGTF